MSKPTTPTPRADTGPGLSGVSTQWEGVTQVAMTLPDPVKALRAPATLRVVEDYPRRVLEAVKPVWDALAAEFEGRRLYVAWAQQCRGPLARWSRVRLTAEERRPVSRALADAGLSARGISLVLGVVDQTIRADLGQSVKAPKAPAVAAPCERCNPPHLSPELRQAASLTGDMPVKTLRVLAMLAMVPSGITSRELEQATGWNHGIASATLTALGQQGKAACSVTRREGFTAYLIVS